MQIHDKKKKFSENANSFFHYDFFLVPEHLAIIFRHFFFVLVSFMFINKFAVIFFRQFLCSSDKKYTNKKQLPI